MKRIQRPLAAVFFVWLTISPSANAMDCKWLFRFLARLGGYPWVERSSKQELLDDKDPNWRHLTGVYHRMLHAAGISSLEADKAVAEFWKKSTLFGVPGPFTGRFMTAAVRDYIDLRKENIPHDHAVQASWETSTTEYLKLRGEKVSHEDALKILRTSDADDFLTARVGDTTVDEAIAASRTGGAALYGSVRTAGRSHEESVEAARILDDDTEYLKISGEGISHKEAMEAARNKEDIDGYMKIRKAGFSHKEAMDVVDNYDAEKYIRLGPKLTHDQRKKTLSILDSGSPAKFRRLTKAGATYEQANAVLRNEYNTKTYAALRARGYTHEEIMEVFRNEWVAKDYARLRRRGGLTHAQATKLLWAEYDVDEVLTLLGHKEMSEKDVSYLLDENLDDEYAKLRAANVSHAQALEVLRSGDVDVDSFLRIWKKGNK